MAPTIATPVSDPLAGNLGLKFRRAAGAPATEVEELRWRNLELESQLRERKEREEEMARELERTRGMLRAVEAAEERLCADLGELEAEAIAQAREYNRRIKVLSDSLVEARRVIESGGARLKICGLG